MKKLSRIAALLAATAMLFGAVSCSEPEEEPISNNTPTFKSETVEVDFKLSEGVSIVSITDGKVADETIVTATVADTKVTLKSVKAGKTTVTAKVTVKTGDGEQAGTGTITVTVADTGKITYVSEWVGDGDPTEPGNPDVPATVNYTANFLQITGGTAVPSDTPQTIDSEAVYDTALILFSPSNRLRLRSGTNNINYNGGTKAAFAVTEVGGTLAETLDRYAGVDVSKLASSGNVVVTISGVSKPSGSVTTGLGQIVLIDQNNKILTSAADVQLASAAGASEFALTATVDATSVTKVILGFSRNGAAGGGIDVTSVTVKSAE